MEAEENCAFICVGISSQTGTLTIAVDRSGEGNYEYLGPFVTEAEVRSALRAYGKRLACEQPELHFRLSYFGKSESETDAECQRIMTLLSRDVVEGASEGEHRLGKLEITLGHCEAIQ